MGGGTETANRRLSPFAGQDANRRLIHQHPTATPGNESAGGCFFSGHAGRNEFFDIFFEVLLNLCRKIMIHLTLRGHSRAITRGATRPWDRRAWRGGPECRLLTSPSAR